ncbi:PAS domain S-box-containing protein [Rhodoblastus acidophilus]|uniref:MASE3 domain-containing protein n=1 Tax=Rhodoblastus acidophilus TaxID=1074 RepID=UPI002224C037|nr:MASE3 domain-containing protein [Rhodoblastus acidophilus]MCW2283975.1 PAS domain S-box-containing protein [Rhodoblastus acidophilus]MCW2332672.1 PAS domain S-box-containing protein [Rhodoblastus acidophilus]
MTPNLRRQEDGDIVGSTRKAHLSASPQSSVFPEIVATIRALSVLEWVALGFGAALAHLAGAYNYLLFHTAVEFFAACICFNIFVILATTQDISQNNFLKIIGVTYMFVGALDLLHAFAFKGMPIFTDYDYYAPQLWVAARYLESGAALVGLLLLKARVQVSVAAVFVIGFAITSASLLAIFPYKIFPICFIPGEGLTPFKVGSEFVIIGIYAAALVLLHRRRALFGVDVFRLLRMSLVASMLMELCFSFYTAPLMDDALNELGHILKIFSFYALYKAIVVGSVRNPLMLVAQELRDSEKRLRQAMAAAGLTYIEVDLAQPAIRFGDNFAEVMGYHPRAGASPDALKAELIAHIDPDDHARFLDAQKRGAVPRSGVELRVIGDDGRLRWIESAASVRKDGDARLFITNLDITARVRARNALVVAKSRAERADQAKSKFLAAASHDLRQPVQALILYLAMIDRQVQDLPKAAETVKRMQAALDGLSNLLTAILDISRLDAGVIAPRLASVDLDDLLARLAHEYAAKAAQRRLDFRTVPRKIFVCADEMLLERALRNLIENAVRYTPCGGVLVGARRRGDRVRIDVVDTGMGVAPERKDEIFMEFVQLDNPGRDMEKGLGLGLAIVSRVARLIDATVEVSSRPRRGSRFSLTLPAAAPIEARPDDELEPSGLGQGRILIVEDNSIVRDGLDAMLRDWGYDTVTAASGEEALALAEAQGPFVAHMLDYSLGRGMSGLETARELSRRAGAKIPTVILTGDTAKDRIAEISASEAEMLHKPVTSAQLRAVLARVAAPVL